MVCEAGPMSTHDPASAAPPPFVGLRDPGDAWVVAPSGERYWGRFGAAGVLVHDAGRGVLLQHRARWSHHGGTWGIPGGALHQGEEPIVGALREAGEEAGVSADDVRVRALHVEDRGVWRYTTVIAGVVRAFEAVEADAESLELRWVPPDKVGGLDLHPAFGAAWPALQPLLGVAPVLVVDVANVMGSRPDGWWRDRAGAARRLVAQLDAWCGRGVTGSAWGLAGDGWVPQIDAVLEGRGRGSESTRWVTCVDAPGAGDDSVVERVLERARAGRPVVVITSDRGLAERVREAGALVSSAGWLLAQLDGEH